MAASVVLEAPAPSGNGRGWPPQLKLLPRVGPGCGGSFRHRGPPLRRSLLAVAGGPTELRLGASPPGPSCSDPRPSAAPCNSACAPNTGLQLRGLDLHERIPRSLADKGVCPSTKRPRQLQALVRRLVLHALVRRVQSFTSVRLLDSYPSASRGPPLLDEGTALGGLHRLHEVGSGRARRATPT